MNKFAIVIIVILLVIGGVFVFGGADSPAVSREGEKTENMNSTSTSQMLIGSGMYTALPEESSIRWAGKKPLIEGYVNSGSLALSRGAIEISDDTASSTFVIDMSTLSVNETPTKPGMESLLKEHLSSERWFDVAQYPTAVFEIRDIAPHADVATSFEYDVEGTLTMHGQTNDITFPARIYMDDQGRAHAEADIEFDRTRWGITAGSGSFFDNLEDNVISDMVALSFDIVAVPQ